MRTQLFLIRIPVQFSTSTILKETIRTYASRKGWMAAFDLPGEAEQFRQELQPLYWDLLT
jgi:hypothetical protein